MKLECLKEKLGRAISQVEKIIGKNSNLPILNCVLLVAEDNGLKIRSTNLDLGIEIDLPVKVLEKGSVAVSGAVIHNFLSNLKDNSIKLETEESNLKVSTENTQVLMKSFPVDEFPTIPKISGEEPFSINAQDFVKGLRSVWYSAAVSSMKPELSSVYINCSDDGELIFAATDSFRLAEKKIKPKKMKDFGQVMIPFKNVPDIIKVLEEAGNDEVVVNLESNQISFSFKNTYLTSRVIDGTFPDYKQIIPKEFETEVVLLKQDLIDSLKIANIFSDKFHQINLRVSSKNKTFESKTKNPDVGENINKIEAVVKGGDIEINFNYKYITDCFQSIDSDSVSLSFSGMSKPMVIKGVSDNSFMYLVMPMNK